MSLDETEKLKAEITKIKGDIDHLWEAIDEGILDESGLAKESEDSAMAICDILERLEKLEEMEETLVYVRKELRDEREKRKNLGCTVIFCGGIALSFMAYRFLGEWASGVVFLGTIAGVASYR
jgi:hypothetical protein